METKLTSATKEVIIGDGRPTVLIGERINPTGKKALAEALRAGNLEPIRKEALAQVQAGADILDVNVGALGVDEVTLLPRAVQAVMAEANVPICLDSANPSALEASLKVYQGKPLINSFNGTKHSLEKILPLAREYGAAVIGLTMDDEGIPNDSERRLAIAHRLVEEADTLGIPREDIIIDCLSLAVGADTRAGLITIEAIRKVKAELGVNITLGASNISFGLPDRNLLNSAFLAIAIAAGVTCPIVDAAQVRPLILAVDLILGYDEYATRYTRAYRQRSKPD